MKQDIHPTYFPSATIRCACGAVYTVGSTVEDMRVEICAACHPLYTGKKKLVDTAGRVDRFERMSAQRAAKTPRTKAKAKPKT